ncbi:MAG: hypothetical protein U9Q15_04400 [Patescibacteria group bacterium]|nr:hypothetical protein [Patescibacteria group bacterium]
MNFPRFFHKKKDTSHIGIILDLGSQYIKSTLIEKKADQICMLGQGKIMHQIGDMEKGGIVHLDHVYKNCILAIEEAKKHSKNNPSQLILAVDGISIHSINTQTEYNRSDSYSQISESEIKNLIHKSQWKAFEQAKKYIKEESNNNEVNIKLLSSSMGDVSIDGFRIQDPVGFTGKNIKISFLNSFCPETFLTGYKQLAKKLELDLLSIVPSFQGVAQGLIEDQGNSSSGILIDIGSHHTQITLIQK